MALIDNINKEQPYSFTKTSSKTQNATAVLFNIAASTISSRNVIRDSATRLRAEYPGSYEIIGVFTVNLTTSRTISIQLGKNGTWSTLYSIAATAIQKQRIRHVVELDASDYIEIRSLISGAALSQSQGEFASFIIRRVN